MHKTLLWISAVALAAGFGFATNRAYDNGRAHVRHRQAETPKSSASNSSLPTLPVGEEVKALRAELARKDAMMVSLLMAKAQAAGPTPEPGTGSAMTAARTLDRRMEQASQPSPAAAQIGIVIRNLDREGVFGETQLTDLKCAGALCRITLRDGLAARLESATRRLAESVGKAAGALIVLDGVEGKKLIYAAESSSDLELPVESSTLAAQEAP